MVDTVTELRKLFITGPDGEIIGNTGDNLNVLLGDPSTRALDLRFVNPVGPDTTLDGPAVVDVRTLLVVDASGFTDGDYITILDDLGGFFFAHIIGPPVGNLLNLDTPIDQPYISGSRVLDLSTNLAVDGSVTPASFKIGPAGGTTEIDITRIIGNIQSDSPMDDSKFGSIVGGLINGCVLRHSNGVIENTWNVKTNGGLALLGFDFAYSDNSQQGSYGMRFRMSYSGQDNHGVVFRLLEDESLEFIIQDDLTDLEIFHLVAHGHVLG